MKIVYVGDNRNRNNFGCRATSTALSQLISENNEIVGRVFGNYTNSDSKYVFFRRWLPSLAYKKLGSHRYWKYIREVLALATYYVHRTQTSMSKFDFVDYDLDKTVNNLIKCLPANDFLCECDLRNYDFDALVVNGEGSFIFSPTAWRESFVEAALMFWAKKMGKKVFFMNAMFSGLPNYPVNQKAIDAVKELFETIDFVGMREYKSMEFAKEYFPKATTHFYPDALFTWYPIINDSFIIGKGNYLTGKLGATDEFYKRTDFTKPYICVSASSSMNIGKNRENSIKAYVELVNSLLLHTKLDVYLVHTCDGDDFLLDVSKKTGCNIITDDTPVVLAGKILANAKVYITGRYHPSILASLGGTPCVYMGSNSHKTLSIQQLLEYENIREYAEVPNSDEIRSMVDDTMYYLTNNETIRKRIKARSLALCEMAYEMGKEIK